MPAQPKLDVKPSLTLKRRHAPPEKVYAAWTDPEKIARWIGPKQVVSARAETDPRVGGHYHFHMRTSDGEEHDVSGVYHEVVPNEKLVFTWAWKSTPERESRVTITFKADGDGTMLTLLHEQFFDEEARDRHKQGWSGSLDKLERYFS
jgi:uncharacterized protein YndB with AHSA1/START domain